MPKCDEGYVYVNRKYYPCDDESCLWKVKDQEAYKCAECESLEYDAAVSSFCMKETKVTKQEYNQYEAEPKVKYQLVAKKCVGGDTYVVASGFDGKELLEANYEEFDGGEICSLELQKISESTKEKLPIGFNGSDQPMVNVTWKEAYDYCKSIGGSLPTEDQCELAASMGIKGDGDDPCSILKEYTLKTSGSDQNASFDLGFRCVMEPWINK